MVCDLLWCVLYCGVQNDQLREEVHDMKRQLEAQRDAMIGRRDGDGDIKDKITQKNLLLNAALDENRVSGAYCR